MMNVTPKHTIDIDKITKELQASFDDDRYIGFLESDPSAQWRNEMTESWKQLVLHTAEVWDFAWQPIPVFDDPCHKRSEWLFRRKESPFKNCSLEDCQWVILNIYETKQGETQQFLSFMLAVLTQGSTLWPYDECKNEVDMEKPES